MNLKKDLDGITENAQAIHSQCLYMEEDIAWFRLPDDVGPESFDAIVRNYREMLKKLAYRVEQIAPRTTEIVRLGLKVEDEQC